MRLDTPQGGFPRLVLVHHGRDRGRIGTPTNGTGRKVAAKAAVTASGCAASRAPGPQGRQGGVSCWITLRV
jgi:hypothetical protein